MTKPSETIKMFNVEFDQVILLVTQFASNPSGSNVAVSKKHMAYHNGSWARL